MEDTLRECGREGRCRGDRERGSNKGENEEGWSQGERERLKKFFFNIYQIILISE